MTYEEAITFVSGHYLVSVDSTDDKYAKTHNEAMDKAIEALKKQIPKKPTDQYSRCGFAVEGCCPKCESAVLPEQNFCRVCGQALDWSDAE